MYVCICNPVTDSQVRQAIAAGCKSLQDLKTNLGVATACGRCSDYATEMLSAPPATGQSCANCPNPS